MSKSVRIVTIFVSSPGDVQAERNLLERIVRRINDTQAEAAGIRFELFRWEQNIVPRIGPKPQQVVDDQTPTYDVYLGIMSRRFGTPTKRYGSGTEEEFREVLAKRECDWPWILFYFNDEAAAAVPLAGDETAQFERVKRFRSEIQENQLGIVAPYRGLDGLDGSFGERVERHLRLLIAKLTELPALRDPFDPIIKNHLDAYLRPGVAFVGREAESAQISRWIDEADRGRMLVTGRAGIGKSAFLSRVQASLRERTDVDLVYFPINVRFGGNRATAFFPSVLSQIAAVRRERLESGPSTIERWCAQLAGYLSKPHNAVDKRLIVIIDGLDEATGWAIDASLWPVILGERVYLVVGARPLAGDADPTTWLSRLGWDIAGGARTLPLSALSRAAVAEGVQTVRPDGPGSAALADEIWRLTAGDPLTFALYLQDLAARPEMTAKELLRTAPGIRGLIDRWWQEQRVIWGSDPLREEKVRTVLGVLACTLGPISRDDLVAAAGPENELSTWSVKDAVVAFSRMLEGDDTRGYSYSHTLIRESVQSQFDRRTLERYRDRYRAWCQETLSELVSGEMEPSAVPEYQLKYLSAHFQENEVEPNTAALLLSRQWIEASHRFDSSWTEFVKDCHCVRSAAAAALRAGPPDRPRPASTLGTHFRAVLSQTSIATMALVLPARMLTALVEHSYWTLDQSLRYARRNYFPSDRFNNLLSLLKFADLNLRWDLLDEMFSLIEPSFKWTAPKHLLPLLGAALRSHDELTRAVEKINLIKTVDHRAAAIATLEATCAVPFDWWSTTERLIDSAVFAFDVPEYKRAEAIATLAHLVPHQDRAGVLDRTGFFEDHNHLRLVYAFLPTDTPERVRLVMGSLNGPQRLSAVAHVPWHTVPDLAESEADRIVNDKPANLFLLVKILPHLEGQARDRLCQVAIDNALRDGGHRETLAALARTVAQRYAAALPSLMIAHESMAFDMLSAAAEHLTSREVEVLASHLCQPEDRGYALLKWVAPVADPQEQDRIVESALATVEGGDLYRSWLLLPELVGHLKPGQVERARAVVRSINRVDDRVDLLLQLSRRVPEPQRGSFFEEVVEIVGSLHADSWVGKQRALDAAAPQLPADMLPAAVTASEAIRDYRSQATLLIAIARRLRGVRKADVLRRAIDLWDRVDSATERVDLLISLIPLLPAVSRRQVARDVVLGDCTESQLALFTAAVGALPVAARQRLLKRAWAVIRSERDPERMAAGAVRLMPHLRNPKEAILVAFSSVPEIDDPNKRVPIIRGVCRQLPRTMVGSALELARREPVDWAKAEMFAALGPVAPEEVLSEVDRALSSGEGVLAAIMLSGVPRGRTARRQVLERLTEILCSLEGSDLAYVLWFSEPHLDEAAATRVLTETERIWDPRSRVEARTGLLPYLPEPARTTTIRSILPLLDSIEERRTDVLRRVAACTSSADAAAECLEHFLKAKWAPDAEALAPLAERAAALSHGRCDDLWRRTCELFLTHETAGRPWALPRLAALIPLLDRIGGADALGAAAEEVRAVCEIWP